MPTVFMSYTHVNNQALVPKSQGWVTLFAEHLQTTLRMQEGGRNLQVWLDHLLGANEHLNRALPQELQQASAFLAMLSPGYVDSSWCPRELEEFIGFQGGGTNRRVFMAEILPTDQRHKLHPITHDLVPRKFWVKPNDGVAPEILGWPVPGTDDKAYWRNITELAYALAARIQEDAATTPTQDRPKAWIALPTDDEQDRWEELAAALRQAGFDVLSPDAAAVAQGDAELVEALKTPLQAADVLVQLLGSSVGRRRNFSTPLPQLQHQAMKHAAQQRNIPLLVWRSAKLEEVTDPTHRQLLTGTVAGGFQDFIAQVKQALQPVSKPRVPVLPASEDEESDNRLKVCVSADLGDSELRKQVRGVLFELGVRPINVLKPDEKLPFSMWRKRYREQLHDSSGLLVLYGSTVETWVQALLNETEKLTSAKHKFHRGLLVNAPPEKSNDQLEILTEDFDGLVFLDWRQGACVDSLHQFVKQLRSDAGGAHV